MNVPPPKMLHILLEQGDSMLAEEVILSSQKMCLLYQAHLHKNAIHWELSLCPPVKYSTDFC